MAGLSHSPYFISLELAWYITAHRLKDYFPPPSTKHQKVGTSRVREASCPSNKITKLKQACEEKGEVNVFWLLLVIQHLNTPCFCFFSQRVYWWSSRSLPGGHDFLLGEKYWHVSKRWKALFLPGFIDKTASNSNQMTWRITIVDAGNWVQSTQNELVNLWLVGIFQLSLSVRK